jgi:hypothetical protein
MNISFNSAFAFVVGTMAAGIVVAMVWPALDRARRQRHFAMVDVLLASSYIGTSRGAAAPSGAEDHLEKRRAARAEEPEAGAMAPIRPRRTRLVRMHISLYSMPRPSMASFRMRTSARSGIGVRRRSSCSSSMGSSGWSIGLA